MDLKISSKLTSKHTVDVNELGTNTLPVSCQLRIKIMCGINHKRGQFTLTHSLVHSLTHSHAEVYILVQIFQKKTYTVGRLSP